MPGNGKLTLIAYIWQEQNDMDHAKPLDYFNEPEADLNNEAYFPSGIYERTKDNPNLNASCLCVPCNDSLDEYASRLSGKILSALT